jgi:signal transduction histidine kinase
MSDISYHVLYEKAKGEQKLLTLINATVSHEMRNPINAIVSQNLLHDNINQRIKDYIDNGVHNNDTLTDILSTN